MTQPSSTDLPATQPPSTVPTGFDSVYDELVWRGLVHQTTGDEALKDLLDGPPVTFYVGFDPTAPSLHVGHLIQIMLLRWLQRTGGKPIALMGGGTTKVGDPTGRDAERSLLAPEGIAVVSLAPGFIATDMAAGLLDAPEGDAIRAQSPFGRVATPEEVARAVVALADPGAEWVSGAVVDFNGASYLR